VSRPDRDGRLLSLREHAPGPGEAGRAVPAAPGCRNRAPTLGGRVCVGCDEGGDGRGL
jgi:hypothetical protein